MYKYLNLTPPVTFPSHNSSFDPFSNPFLFNIPSGLSKMANSLGRSPLLEQTHLSRGFYEIL